MPIRIQDNKNLPAIIPQRPSFLQSVKEGVGLGIGYRIAGAFMGPLGHSTPSAPISPPIKEHVPELKNKEYEQCMQEFNDKAVCETYKY